MSGWWREAGRFDSFSIYLRDRGLERRWRLAIFAFTWVLGALPVVLLASPVGPATPVWRAVAIAAGGLWVLVANYLDPARATFGASLG